MKLIDWEEVRVRADAREWFSERISLIAWFWDDDEPGGYQPSLVARCFDRKQPYPRAVRREPPKRIDELLRSEWQRAGKRNMALPKVTAWQDFNGRTAWRIDLGGVPEDQRILVGRTLIHPFFPRIRAFSGMSRRKHLQSCGKKSPGISPTE